LQIDQCHFPGQGAGHCKMVNEVGREKKRLLKVCYALLTASRALRVFGLVRLAHRIWGILLNLLVAPHNFNCDKRGFVMGFFAVFFCLICRVDVYYLVNPWRAFLFRHLNNPLFAILMRKKGCTIL